MFEFIEGFYNGRRRPSSIGYLCPITASIVMRAGMEEGFPEVGQKKGHPRFLGDSEEGALRLTFTPRRPPIYILRALFIQKSQISHRFHHCGYDGQKPPWIQLLCSCPN